MASLTPTTALGGTTPFDKTIGPVRIAEQAAPVMASLAMLKGKSAGFAKAANAHLGALPAPGKMQTRNRTGTIWMGPDQYLVEGMEAVALAAAFGASAAITDQSDAWVRFDVTGDDVVAMLERLSNADSRRMAQGDATRTAIHHMHCVVICRNGGTDFTILGPRSSAASLHHALVAAAASL
ncbi:MAG: sarcosine oxidase subunit gamma [Pseudomonadota bacterium]|nr:sarcosine oxidase subunit gamma [Pseudomonadota bacterium]MEC7237476.1 sarcosine oxidase subunit gamma [Pseudomonadota bacterium]